MLNSVKYGVGECLYCDALIVFTNNRDKTRKKFCNHSCRAKYRHQENLYSERDCLGCFTNFKPTGPNQRTCKVCTPDKTSYFRFMKYGVTKPMWDKMLEEQGGLCYLCSEKAVVMDHSHITLKARRPLCHACNIGLGRFELPGWREKALLYVGGEQNSIQI